MELIDIVDENNNLTGQVADRDEIHRKGLWHREITVIIVNEENKLLLQKRAATKTLGANKWSLTMGHIDSGETEKVAALRETQEELGIDDLKPDDLKLLSVEKSSRQSGDIINSKFENIYYYKTSKQINEFVLQKSEVSEIRYFSIDELKEICENKEKYEQYFTRVFFQNYFWKILAQIEKI